MMDDGGLESDLVERYAKLKAGSCTTKKNERSRSGKVDLKRNTTTEHEKAAISLSAVQFNSAEDDGLSAELEARLQALKSQFGLPSASDKSTKTTAAIVPLFKENSIANSSSAFASSLSLKSSSASPCLPPESSSSISYVDTVDSASSNALPHKVKAILTLSAKGEDEQDDLEVAEAEVRKLLRSVRDEVRLAKEERQRQKRSLQESFVVDDDSLFDVEEMEDEYVQASEEEDRLAHAAEEVVKWAKDAASLSVSESDDELDTDKSDILNVSVKNHLSKSKQKKGKRWSLFRRV